jgi:hypothetical protein
MYSSITYAVRAKITQIAILPQKIPPTPIIYHLILMGVILNTRKAHLDCYP